MAATCHYCGQRQSRRGLRPLELSAAGSVQVCRDADACRTRARVGALVPTRAHETSATRPRRRYLGRSGTWWAITSSILILGLVVLPHVAIHGHRYHFWLIP